MPTTLRLPTATGSIRRRHFRNKPEISGFLWPPAQNQIDSFQLLLRNKHLVKNNRRPEQCMDPLSCYNLEGSTPLPILLKSLGYRDLVPCRPQQKAVPVPLPCAADAPQDSGNACWPHQYELSSGEPRQHLPCAAHDAFPRPSSAGTEWPQVRKMVLPNTITQPQGFGQLLNHFNKTQ